MSTVAYNRRVGKTGHPIGLIDVLGKIAETGLGAARQWFARRQALRLAMRRSDAVREVVRDANAVRRLARQCRDSQPGQAADLYAAADGHELKHGC